MFSHIMIGTNDLARAERFYTAVLGVLGAGEPHRNKNTTGQTRLFYRHNGNTFSLSEPINGEPVTVANGSTIGFKCESAEQLKQFHDVAIANGATTIEEAPGPRGDGAMHLAYFRDPDGHKICGVYRA